MKINSRWIKDQNYIKQNKKNEKMKRNIFLTLGKEGFLKMKNQIIKKLTYLIILK